MVDTDFASAINRATESDSGHTQRLPEKCSLFVKFVGPSQAHLTADWKFSQPILKRMGGIDMRYVDQPKAIEDLWSMRKLALMYAQQFPLSPYAEDNDDDKGSWRFIGTDACVPLSRLPALVRKMKDAFVEQEIYAPILGHVGDGNVHAGLMWRQDDKAKEEKVHKLIDETARMAQELEGTCTGEHGVGLGKRHLIANELGPQTVNLLRRIKEELLDPNNIMNPGKLLPPLRPGEQVHESV